MIKPSIYIAGPMRGYENYNYEAFNEAEEYLESLNKYSFIVNPAKLCPSTADIQTIIRVDIAAVLSVDELFVLTGFNGSYGARAEIAVAAWRGIPIIYQETKPMTTEEINIYLNSLRVIDE